MNINFLKTTLLFRGMDENELADALEFLQAKEQNFEKGSMILHAGTVTNKMGLVLEGSVTVESDDLWGNRSILSHAETGHFFAETYSLLPDEPMLVK